MGKYLTTEDILEALGGRCEIRQYIANKSAKKGIKIVALVDS